MGAGRRSHNEFLRRSLWRNRTTPRRRTVAAVVTFSLLTVFGGVLMVLAMEGLGRLGAPGWVVASLWLVPTVAMSVWALTRPAPAILTDDDDDSWVGYAIRLVMVGGGDRRPAPIRLIAAVVFGAPIAWALAVFVLAELVGIF